VRARPCLAARPVYDLGPLRTRAVMRDTPPALMCEASAWQLRLGSRRAGPSGGMADAGDSKSPGGNPVRVRLSPRALEGTRTCTLSTRRARTRPTMQRLPELKPTPVRPRHPLIYGAGFFLFIAMAGFIGRIGMIWVLSTTTLAVVMAIGAIAIAVRAR